MNWTGLRKPAYLSFMRSDSQSGPSRHPGMTPSGGCLALLAEMESCLEDSQQALLSRNLNRIQELTAKQKLLFEAICASNATPDEDLRVQAAQVLRLGRTQLAILRRAQRMLRVISNFHVGIQSVYEAGRDTQGVVVRQTAAFREV